MVYENHLERLLFFCCNVCTFFASSTFSQLLSCCVWTTNWDAVCDFSFEIWIVLFSSAFSSVLRWKRTRGSPSTDTRGWGHRVFLNPEVSPEVNRTNSKQHTTFYNHWHKSVCTLNNAIFFNRLEGTARLVKAI